MRYSIIPRAHPLRVNVFSSFSADWMDGGWGSVAWREFSGRKEVPLPIASLTMQYKRTRRGEAGERRNELGMVRQFSPYLLQVRSFWGEDKPPPLHKKRLLQIMTMGMMMVMATFLTFLFQIPSCVVPSSSLRPLCTYEHKEYLCTVRGGAILCHPNDTFRP